METKGAVCQGVLLRRLRPQRERARPREELTSIRPPVCGKLRINTGLRYAKLHPVRELHVPLPHPRPVKRRDRTLYPGTKARSVRLPCPPSEFLRRKVLLRYDFGCRNFTTGAPEESRQRDESQLFQARSGRRKAETASEFYERDSFGGGEGFSRPHGNGILSRFSVRSADRMTASHPKNQMERLWGRSPQGEVPKIFLQKALDLECTPSVTIRSDERR